MIRSSIILLLALTMIPLILTLAAPLRASSESHMKIEREIIVAPLSPRVVLELRYPNGGSMLYEGDRIPSSLTVDVGTRVGLRLFARVKEPGIYTVRAEASTLVDVPSGYHVGLWASAQTSNMTGNADAGAGFMSNEYFPGLAVRLEVYYQAFLDDGSSDSLYKIVTVTVRAPPSSTQSQSQTGSGTVTPVTFVPPGSSTTTSSTYSPGTVKWITSTTEVRELSVDPSKREVDAGDIATFDLCTSLDSPKFRVEDLPVGYRYIVSKGGECYKLKIFTHPLSYGTFEMGVVAYQGNVEERSTVTLTVRKVETTTSASETTETTTGSPTQQSSVKPTLETRQTSQAPQSIQTTSIVTVVKTVPEESFPLTEALGALTAALGLALIILLVRRRS